MFSSDNISVRQLIKVIPLLLFFLIISYPSQAYFYFNTGYSYSPISYSGFSYYGGSVYPYFYLPRYLYAGPQYFRMAEPFQPSFATQIRLQKQAESLLMSKIAAYYAAPKNIEKPDVSIKTQTPFIQENNIEIHENENVEIRYY